MGVSSVARLTWKLALRAVARIVAAFLVYFCVQLVVLQITDSPIWAAVGGAVSTVPIYWILSTLSPDQGMSHFRRPRRSAWLWASGLVLVWFAGQSFAIQLGWLFPELTESYARRVEEMSSVPVVATLLLTLIMAPVAEELLLRGVLYREMRRGLRLPVWLAVSISAVIFALMHGNATQISSTLLLGAFLALTYEHTCSILVPIALHALFNIMSTFVPAQWVVPAAELAPMVVLNVLALSMIVLLCIWRRR